MFGEYSFFIIMSYGMSLALGIGLGFYCWWFRRKSIKRLKQLESK